MVSPSDTVAEEDALITLESDKASMDVPAPFAGTTKEMKLTAGGKTAPELLESLASNQLEGKDKCFYRGTFSRVADYPIWQHVGPFMPSPVFALRNMESFLAMDPIEPTAEAVGILRNILARIRNAPNETTGTNLQKELFGCFESNQNERIE